MYNIKNILFIFFSLCFLLVLSCEDKNSNTNPIDEIDYSKAPKGFPPIPFPKDNQYSPTKEKLGRYLFFEKILSRDSTYSCANCHNPRYAFANNVPNPITINKFPLPRNVLSLVNVGYRKSLNWDGVEITLEEAIYHDFTSPLFFDNDTNEIFQRLSSHPFYPKMFEAAFGKGSKPYPYLAAKAIATFVRTLVSGTSSYDKFINGDSSALTEKQKLGMRLFFSERTRCSECHSGFLFTDLKYHNTGTTNHYFDFGRYYITGDYKDRSKLKTPSLRNVEITAPYIHDGTYQTLEKVIENYNRGGFPFFNKDTTIKPLNLTNYEKEALLEFLKSLTDWDFLNQPRFKTFGY
ncbi:MAG: cytochrome-c peroxidase [Ignavibacteria bacterium]|nr:cytochrome-c peroxidase [Ignavibacteria bacterium]